MDPSSLEQTNSFTQVLLWISDVILAMWNAILHYGGAFFVWLSDVLNIVLSPLLKWLNPVCNWLGDATYAVVGLLPIWVGFTLLSAIFGVILLILFGKLSNQKAIERTRNKMTAHLLAIKLYKDEIGVTFSSFGKLCVALAAYQWHMLWPVAILLFPMVLVMAQMGVRYEWRPLRPGEASRITMELNDDSAVRTVHLAGSPGVTIEASILGDDRADWRVMAAEPGHHTLTFNVDDETFEKELVVDEGWTRVSAERPGYNWVHQVMHPTERPFNRNDPVRAVIIDYPHVENWYYGSGWWALWFFVISIAFALIFKPVFNVKF